MFLIYVWGGRGETLNVTQPGACLFHVSLACILACCSSRVSTDLQLGACSKKRHLRLPVFLYALRGDTHPGLRDVEGLRDRLFRLFEGGGGWRVYCRL